MSFRTTLLLHGKSATGIEVPSAVVDGLAAGRKPAVVATVNGYAYRTTIAARGGVFLIPFSSEHRAAAGIEAGDDVEVTIELDTAPREVAIPDDLAEALRADAAAGTFFAGLTASQQRGFVTWVEQAKKAETRAARVEKSVTALREGRKQH